MRFFFYGTLIDPDVRRLVLGADAPASVEKAWLAGWRRVPMVGRTYPGLVRDPLATVDGVLARGFDEAAKTRLDRYEGDEYELIMVEVETETSRRVAARVYVPRPGSFRRGRGMWDYGDWARRHKRRFLATLERSGGPS